MVWFNTTPFPWFGPYGLGGLNGIQVPEEVPATPPTPSEQAKEGVKLGAGKSNRQSVFSPFNPAYGPVVDSGFMGPGPSSISEARDSNGSNALAALSRATRKIPGTYFNYRKMRADGIVAIGREIADALICTSEWAYEAADKDVPADLVEAIKNMWEGRGTIGESHEGYSLREFFLSESCRAKDYGNHTMEVVYGTDDHGNTVLDEFLPLLPENTRPLLYQGTRKFAGVNNYGVSGDVVELDPLYCVRFVYDSEGGDLFGRSRFENCKDWIQLKWDIRDKIRTDLNISIGNIMTVRFPVSDTGNVAETDRNRLKADTIGLSLAKGISVSVPDFSITQKLAWVAAGIDPDKVEAWPIKRLETGPNSFDGFKVAVDLVDEQILFGMLCLPRAVREADHGAKADAEQHTDSMETIAWRWITYVVGLANNFTDVILWQRGHNKGSVRIKAVPLSDESLGTLKKIMGSLLADQKLALTILDFDSATAKLKIKLRPGFNQEQLLKKMEQEAATQNATNDFSSRERMRRAGMDETTFDKVKLERAEDDAVPTDEDDLVPKK